MNTVVFDTKLAQVISVTDLGLDPTVMSPRVRRALPVVAPAQSPFWTYISSAQALPGDWSISRETMNGMV